MKNTSDQLYKQVRAEVFGSIAKFQGGGKPSTRGAAFQAARDAGEREFTYNNNSFHTRKEGESKQDWEKFLGGRRPAAQPAAQPVVQNLAGTVDGVVPQNQTAFRQDTRSNFAIKAANMKDNLLYKMGWKSDGDAEGKGRTRKLAENVVIPAVAGTALAGAPLVAGAIGAVNLPGSISQAHASWTDPNATTGERIRESFPLVANTAAVGFGAYNLPSSMRNLNTRVMGNSYGIQSQRVMDPNAGKGVSTKVKAPKSSNTRVQKMGKGEGHQGGVRNSFRQSSTGGTSAKTTHYQQAPTTRNAAPAREVGGWQMNRPNTPIVPTWGTPPVPVSTRQQPQEAAEYTPVPFRPRPASKPALQEVNFSAPFYGSPEFQQAYAEAERQGLSEFNFGNSPYKVERGANYRQGRTVSPQGVNPNIVNSPNSRFTHFPDSTSYSGVVNNPSSTQVNTLNYGVTGNPRIDTTSINNLRAAMRKLGGRVNYISY